MSTAIILYEPEKTSLVDNDAVVIGDSADGGKPKQAKVSTLRQAIASGVVNLTAATLAVTQALHGGKVVTINRAAGSTLTLPAASGSGAVFKFFVGTTVTSNAIVIQAASASDSMAGLALVAQDGGDTAVAFETAADSDTITMNGTTKGGILGDMIEVIDVASGKFWVRVTASASGTEVTPFSADVS